MTHSPQSPQPTVVLVHGLLRSRRSVASLARRLEAAGYQTWAVSYPSRSLDLAGLADWLAARISAELADRPLFAVTHSLGGVLVRLLADRLPWTGAVLIAPPNGGSRAAGRFVRLGLFRAIYGQAGVQLGEAAQGGLKLPDPPRPFGILAGTRRVALGNPTSWLTHPLGVFGRDAVHDGTVALAETQHVAMTDFAEIDASHTWILDHPDTARQVLAFLRRGHFEH